MIKILDPEKGVVLVESETYKRIFNYFKDIRKFTDLYSFLLKNQSYSILDWDFVYYASVAGVSIRDLFERFTVYPDAIICKVRLYGETFYFSSLNKLNDNFLGIPHFERIPYNEAVNLYLDSFRK